MKIKGISGTVFVFYLLMMVGVNQTAFGATHDFDGGPGGTGQDWNTGVNWGLDVVPGTNDLVRIGFSPPGPFNVNLNSPNTFTNDGTLSQLIIYSGNTLTVKDGASLINDDSGNGITINSGATLTIDGTLSNVLATDTITVDGTLVITGTGTFTNDGAVVGSGIIQCVGNGTFIDNGTTAGSVTVTGCDSFAWHSQTSGTTETLISVSAVDANTAWAVGNNGVILKTTDGGSTWSPQTSGTTETLWEVSAVDASTAWVSGTNDVILKTTDGGSNWVIPSGTLPPQVTNLYGVSAISDQIAWASGDGGFTVIKTIDGGDNWTYHPASNHIWYDVEAIDATTAWAVGSEWAIDKTINGGAGWVNQLDFVTSDRSFTDITVVNTNVAWVAGSITTPSSIPEIRYTTDGGTTWTPQTIPSPGTVVTVRGMDSIDANTAWAVGNNGQILHTTNAGTTWTSQPTGSTAALFEVSAVDASTAWAVGSNGIILKRFDSSAVEGTVTIQGVCEIDLATGSLSFVAGDPISNGLDVGTGEISEVMTNSLGNLGSMVGVFGTDWTDGGALTVMTAGNTKVDTVSNPDITTKTALTTTQGTAVPLGTIAPQTSITTYWDVQIVMDPGALGYSGPAVQTITVDFTCV